MQKTLNRLVLNPFDAAEVPRILTLFVLALAYKAAYGEKLFNKVIFFQWRNRSYGVFSVFTDVGRDCFLALLE